MTVKQLAEKKRRGVLQRGRSKQMKKKQSDKKQTMSCLSWKESLFGKKCKPKRKCVTSKACSTDKSKPVAERQVIFSVPGTYSWTVPASVFGITTDGYGAGGGGGGTSVATVGSFGGGGGGSGAHFTGTLPVQPNQVFSIVVGAAGLAGTSTTNGTAGGDTTLNGATYVLSAGGGGGGETDTGVPGAGGVGSSNTVYIAVEDGQDGASGVSFTPGLGGSAPTGGPGGYPGGTNTVTTLSIAPTNGIQPGGGGGASVNIGVVANGADGAAGYLAIKYVQQVEGATCSKPIDSDCDSDSDSDSDCD